MKVKDLIAELQTHDPDMVVVAYNGGEYFSTITHIEQLSARDALALDMPDDQPVVRLESD